MEKSYDAKHISKILKYDYVFRIFTHKRVFKLRKRGNLPC